jgi:signal transduction histidine kinase
VPRELGYLLLTLPIVVAGLGILSSVFWTGIGTIIIYIGLFLVLGSLYIARGFGTVERTRLRWSGRAAIESPRWVPVDKPHGFVRRTFGPIVNGHYWLYLLHGMLINPIVGIVSWAIALGWVTGGLGGVTYWFWTGFLPNRDQTFFPSQTVFDAVFPQSRFSFDPNLGDSILFLGAGAILLVTLPLVTHTLTSLHDAIARGLLGGWRSEMLLREVADLTASRGAAVVAEDQSLRRLERDIHDGPQQRLVRLQMDLATADRRLDDDPEAVRGLLRQAGVQAQDALEELRALSRGFAPPILQDRGLVAGLDSLVARSTVPVSFDNRLDDGIRFAPELERSAYFVVAELLTNVAKHSGASAARVGVGVRREALTGETWFDINVSDDGSGGAAVIRGHGLGGVAERARGLRGSLTIQSPAGGPTVIDVHLPVDLDAAG